MTNKIFVWLVKVSKVAYYIVFSIPPICYKKNSVIFYPEYCYSGQVNEVWGMAVACQVDHKDFTSWQVRWVDANCLMSLTRVECPWHSMCLSFIQIFAYHLFIPRAFVNNSNWLWIDTPCKQCQKKSHLIQNYSLYRRLCTI